MLLFINGGDSGQTKSAKAGDRWMKWALSCFGFISLVSELSRDCCFGILSYFLMTHEFTLSWTWVPFCEKKKKKKTEKYLSVKKGIFFLSKIRTKGLGRFFKKKKKKKTSGWFFSLGEDEKSEKYNKRSYFSIKITSFFDDL